MKKILILVILLALGAGIMEVSAQSRRDTDEYFDESGGFGHRLWYGTHFTVGYNGNGFESLFQFGLAPMIGYKFNDILSVGPRFSFLYSNYRQTYAPGDVQKVSATSWSVGAFGRFRPFPTLFAQIEYNIENEPVFYQNLTVERIEQNAFYIGAGYNSGSGGPLAFEALLMYHVNQPGNTIQSPLDYRIGITYKF